MERKLFKFYKSYFDVMNELPESKQLEFIKAILNKEFFNIEPELTGIVKLAYISQKHSIDRQVIGFEDKTGIKITPMQGGVIGGVIGGIVAPTPQLEVEVEVEVEVEIQIKIEFTEFWNLYNKKVGSKSNCEKKWLKLSDLERQKVIDTLPLFISNITDKKFQPHPETYLNKQRWNDEIETSLMAEKTRKYTLTCHMGDAYFEGTEAQFAEKNKMNYYKIVSVI